MREGSKEARQILIVHNTRLVIYQVVNKFCRFDYDKKELVCVGIVGLIKAIDTFDISKGYKFISYATTCIDNEILMFLRKLKKSNVEESLDTIFLDNEDEEYILDELLLDDIDIIADYVEKYEKPEIYIAIREIVNQLPPREKTAVILYFGFYDNPRHNQEQISKKLEVSRSTVSKILTKAINRIGLKLKDMGLIELHESCKKRKKNN